MRRSIHWTGPEGSQDFLTVAPVGSANGQYLRWAPAAEGNPTLLAAPDDPGAYEIRYLSGDDGEVQARHPFEVIVVEVTIDVPSVVDAGTRFEVAWTGTTGDGDFISVSRPRSHVKNYLDWAFTSFGSPVTLAAPFEPGSYVVRYVSGANNEIKARRRLKVR